jgi:FkbM family methyltransferase
VNTERLVPRVLSKLAAWRRIATNPSVLRVALRGYSVSAYLALRQPWLQRFGFRTVVDVGANVGQFALLARAAFPGAALHCFEPLPDWFAELERRLGAAPGVTLHRMALGDRAGTARMTRNPYSPSSSLLEMAPRHVQAFPFTGGGEVLSVPLSTLDAAIEDGGVALATPLLVKIDVQGAEDRVIAGGRGTLGRAAVVIVETSFEPLYEGQLLFDGVFELMRGLGFGYHGSLSQLTGPRDGRILQCDAIFLRQA